MAKLLVAALLGSLFLLLGCNHREKALADFILEQDRLTVEALHKGSDMVIQDLKRRKSVTDSFFLGLLNALDSFDMAYEHTLQEMNKVQKWSDKHKVEREIDMFLDRLLALYKQSASPCFKRDNMMDYMDKKLKEMRSNADSLYCHEKLWEQKFKLNIELYKRYKANEMQLMVYSVVSSLEEVFGGRGTYFSYYCPVQRDFLNTFSATDSIKAEWFFNFDQEPFTMDFWGVNPEFTLRQNGKPIKTKHFDVFQINLGKNVAEPINFEYYIYDPVTRDTIKGTYIYKPQSAAL